MNRGVALVTGGAGFIGSHLVHALVAQGWHTHVIDDLSTGSACSLPPEVALLPGDVASPEALQLVERVQPHCVFHCAAQASVPASVADPLEDARINILGTLAMLSASASAGVASFVLTSSGGALYGDTGDGKATEDWPLCPISPYGVSKLAAERYLRLFSAQAGVRCVSARLANVYGPRQGGDAGGAGVIARFTRQLLSGQTPVVHGDGTQVRDYVAVSDAVEALLRLARVGDAPAYNIGSGMGTSLITLLDHLAVICGTAVEPRYRPTRPGDIHSSVLDVTLAGRDLGWCPSVSLPSGLSEMVARMRESGSG